MRSQSQSVKEPSKHIPQSLLVLHSLLLGLQLPNLGIDHLDVVLLLFDLSEQELEVYILCIQFGLHLGLDHLYLVVVVLNVLFFCIEIRAYVVFFLELSLQPCIHFQEVEGSVHASLVYESPFGDANSK